MFIYNNSSIRKDRKDIVALLRKYGGKANNYDKNGNEVEGGKGDLNDILNDANDALSLTRAYQLQYPEGAPLVLACEKGRLEDVRMLVEGHDVEKTGMSLDEMVSKEGKNRDGYSITPLQQAANKEQFEIVQFLVTTCTNKVGIIGQTNRIGVSSLHYAASGSKKNVQTLQFLIDNYNGKDIKTIINQKDKYGSTPLDYAYAFNDSPIKNEIVSLLRKYGGKANCFDKNGNNVGEGKGDLND